MTKNEKLAREDGDTGVGREKCPNCGMVGIVGWGMLIPVWQDPKGAVSGEEPDFIGCTECHTMHPYPFEEVADER